MIYRPLRYEQMMRAAEAYDVRARRMFGGMGIYTGEKMFAFLLGDDIGLKLAPEDQATALDLPGAGPMKTDKNEPMRDYVKMPRNVLDNLDTFTEWVERSASYAPPKGQQQRLVPPRQVACAIFSTGNIVLNPARKPIEWSAPTRHPFEEWRAHPKNADDSLRSAS